jgi:plastocyanin
MLRIALRLLAAIAVLAALGAGSVAPAIAGGGCHGFDGTVHTEGAATVVKMDTCAFAPTVVHVPVGAEVRFLNTAQVDHLVVGESQSWGTDDALSPGAELRRRFADPGIYPYSCPMHPGMVGAVVVGDADAAAVVPAPVAPVPSPAAPVAAQAGAAASTSSNADVTLLLPILGVAILAAAILAGSWLIAKRGTRPAAAREP